MAGTLQGLRTPARIALGLIRLFNGTYALVAPVRMARQLGLNPEANPGIQYPLRMFGIRTILVALELLLPGKDSQRRALKVAPLIHVSDVTAASLTLIGNQLPRRAAAMTVAISAVNVVLALIASSGLRDDD